MLQIVSKPFQFVFGETPDGDIDGVNQDFFATVPFREYSLSVYLNGLKLREGLSADYQSNNLNAIMMNYAPLPGDTITFDYIKR